MKEEEEGREKEGGEKPDMPMKNTFPRPNTPNVFLLFLLVVYEIKL